MRLEREERLCVVRGGHGDELGERDRRGNEGEAQETRGWNAERLERSAPIGERRPHHSRRGRRLERLRELHQRHRKVSALRSRGRNLVSGHAPDVELALLHDRGGEHLGARGAFEREGRQRRGPDDRHPQRVGEPLHRRKADAKSSEAPGAQAHHEACHLPERQAVRGEELLDLARENLTLTVRRADESMLHERLVSAQQRERERQRRAVDGNQHCGGSYQKQREALSPTLPHREGLSRREALRCRSRRRAPSAAPAPPGPCTW